MPKRSDAKNLNTLGAKEMPTTLPPKKSAIACVKASQYQVSVLWDILPFCYSNAL